MKILILIGPFITLVNCIILLALAFQTIAITCGGMKFQICSYKLPLNIDLYLYASIEQQQSVKVIELLIRRESPRYVCFRIDKHPFMSRIGLRDGPRFTV